MNESKKLTQEEAEHLLNMAKNLLLKGLLSRKRGTT